MGSAARPGRWAADPAVRVPAAGTPEVARSGAVGGAAASRCSGGSVDRIFGPAAIHVEPGAKVAFRPSMGGVAAGVLAVLVAVVCIRLGLWQLDRLDQRRALNSTYREALALPVLDLRDDTLAAVRARPDAFAYRRARLTGTPDPGGDVVWRGRSLDGRPGVNILTPYRSPGGAVMANRGWAPSADAANVRLRPLREAVADPIGVLIPLPDAPEQARPVFLGTPDGRVLSVQLPDAALLARHVPDLLPLYAQLLPDQPAPPGLTRLPLPDLADEGPHLSYAVQWFAFAGIALFGFLSVVLLRARSAGR